MTSVAYVCQDFLQQTHACHASEPRSPSWCCIRAALLCWRRQPCQRDLQGVAASVTKAMPQAVRTPARRRAQGNWQCSTRHPRLVPASIAQSWHPGWLPGVCQPSCWHAERSPGLLQALCSNAHNELLLLFRLYQAHPRCSLREALPLPGPFACQAAFLPSALCCLRQAGWRLLGLTLCVLLSRWARVCQYPVGPLQLGHLWGRMASCWLLVSFAGYLCSCHHQLGAFCLLWTVRPRLRACQWSLQYQRQQCWKDLC